MKWKEEFQEGDIVRIEGHCDSHCTCNGIYAAIINDLPYENDYSKEEVERKKLDGRLWVFFLDHEGHCFPKKNLLRRIEGSELEKIKKKYKSGRYSSICWI